MEAGAAQGAQGPGKSRAPLDWMWGLKPGPQGGGNFRRALSISPPNPDKIAMTAKRELIDGRQHSDTKAKPAQEVR